MESFRDETLGLLLADAVARGATVERSCLTCGVAFNVKASRLRKQIKNGVKRPGGFCSNACRDYAKRLNLAEGKTCPKCRTHYANPSEGFYVNATTRHGFQSYCVACCAENPERHRERGRLRYKVPENRERQAAYRAANADKYKEYAKTYRLAHPEKTRANRQRYRARVAAAPGNHTDADIKRIHEDQKGLCYWCREDAGERYHVDHVVPLSRGGSNDPDNLVIACLLCNSRKQNKMPDEFLRSVGASA